MDRLIYKKFTQLTCKAEAWLRLLPSLSIHAEALLSHDSSYGHEEDLQATASREIEGGSDGVREEPRFQFSIAAGTRQCFGSIFGSGRRRSAIRARGPVKKRGTDQATEAKSVVLNCDLARTDGLQEKRTHSAVQSSDETEERRGEESARTPWIAICCLV